MPQNVQGPLSKWTNVIQGWQFRWFILESHSAILSYYTSKENMSRGERRGCIRLGDAFIGYDNEDDITFSIKTADEKTFHLQATNLEERKKWVTAIEKSIRHHKNYDPDLNCFGFNSESELNNDFTLMLGSLKTGNFDKTLSFEEKNQQLLHESQKYIEIMSKNFKTLHDRFSGENSQNSTQNEDQIGKISDKKSNFLKSSQILIQTLKHSTDWLQMIRSTKEDQNQENEEYEDFFQIILDLKEKIQQLHQDNSKNSKFESRRNTSSLNEKSKIEISSMDEISSYLSSEDDDSSLNSTKIAEQRTHEDNESDDFYDAIDNSSGSSVVNDLSKKDCLEKRTEMELSKQKHEEKSNTEAVKNEITTELDQKKILTIKSSSSQIDWEDLVFLDEDPTSDDVDLNNHQSVISHLLTQVRIGMDLTKITLPTFILETRSLLEMYADFFAHTDLFLRIAEIKNSHERMIQVVKWYLSTFHAGRKSPVPKKPYNPILGEVFQCWYDIPEYSSSDNTNVCDGPIPWATKDQLTFVAEQVSHHPPISAFYAEHLDKRIQLDGYTWTKSKFLGLSIGVHMVGKAVLSLLDFNEEYEFTFPSAFGRSILTVPWFELGGQVTINCLKSGYSSNIDFVTKPFYGGKKHQIQGSIFGPDKKILHTIEGEWNGTMFIKTGKKQEIFLSTNNAVSYKKKTRSLVEQLDNESRKLWKEVSYYLHTKQIELATDAKQRIEQKQRDESKLRKERNLKWKPRYFNEKGENWVYINPLIKRLHNKI